MNKKLLWLSSLLALLPVSLSGCNQSPIGEKYPGLTNFPYSSAGQQGTTAQSSSASSAASSQATSAQPSSSSSGGASSSSSSSQSSSQPSSSSSTSSSETPPQPVMYTVTFKSEGGTPVASQEIAAGGLVAQPDNPSKTGYTFDAWYVYENNQPNKWIFNVYTVNNDVELVAFWNINHYSLTISSEDNTKGTVSESSGSYDYNTQVSITATAAYGYHFTGWYSQNSELVSNDNPYSIAMTENRILTAHFAADTERTYIAQFKNGDIYLPMTNASVSNVAPEDQSNAGAYVYYDNNNAKWTYYTVTNSSGSESQTFNVYSLSYQGISTSTSTTYYLKYEDGVLGYTETAPTSYQANPEYYFALLPTIGSTGITSIKDGEAGNYFIYAPHFNKYLYAQEDLDVNQRNTLVFGDLETIQSSACQQSQFAIQGSVNTTISLQYGETTCFISGYIYQQGFNDPKISVPVGSRPPFSFTLHGDSEKSGSISEYSAVFEKTTSSWTPSEGDIISIVYENGSVAMSSTQNNNNRGQAPVVIENDSFVPNNTVGRFKLGTNTVFPGLFSLQDVTPEGASANKYLSADGGSSNNYLRSTDTATEGKNYFGISTDTVYATSVTRGKVMYNAASSLFSCYSTSYQGGQITVYKYAQDVKQIHYEGALSVTESGSGPEKTVMVYDVYYYEEIYGISSRALLTRQDAVFNLSGSVTYVTLPL